MSQSFLILKFTKPASATDVIRSKCQPQFLPSRPCLKMQNYWENSLRTSLQQPITINTMEFCAGYLLGTTTYEQIMRENNFFLTMVATIPVNLEYNAWFAVIDPNQTSESDPVSLYNHLVWKPWFLQIESVTKNKCFIVTTKSNLVEACEWIDANLEPMIWKSIPLGINPPTASLPCRLDKPVHSEMSKTFAKILKQQFSMTSTPNSSNATATNRPPCKRQAAILDYDSERSTDVPAAVVATPSTNSSSLSTSTTATPIPTDYATKLMSLKTEISELRTIITSAVAQFKSAIASLPMQCNSSNDMETEPDHYKETKTSCQSVLEIQDLVTDLKHDIATFVLETKALFHQQTNLKLTNYPMNTSVTGTQIRTSVGLPSSI